MDEAEKIYSDVVAPLQAEQSTSHHVVVTLDSMLPRARRRIDAIDRMIPDSIEKAQKFSQTEEKAFATIAARNADSARLDSVVVASLRGRSSVNETLWYVGTLELYFGNEIAYWNALSDLSWNRAVGRDTERSFQQFFKEKRSLSGGGRSFRPEPSIDLLR